MCHESLMWMLDIKESMLNYRIIAALITHNTVVNAGKILRVVYEKSDWPVFEIRRSS